MKKHKATVYLDDIHVSGLKLVSKSTRVRQAELIRQGIDLVLEKHGHHGFQRDENLIHPVRYQCDHTWRESALGWRVCLKCNQVRR